MPGMSLTRRCPQNGQSQIDVMQFLHIKHAFLAVFVSIKGQYCLRDANADPAGGTALAVRFQRREALTFPPGEGFFCCIQSWGRTGLKLARNAVR